MYCTYVFHCADNKSGKRSGLKLSIRLGSVSIGSQFPHFSHNGALITVYDDESLINFAEEGNEVKIQMEKGE